MDGLASVRLGVGLRQLLASIGVGGLYDFDYVVEGGVVTVATVEALPEKRMEMRVYNLPAALRASVLTEQLILAIQEGTAPETWFELSDNGEGTITPCDGTRLVILQTPEVHGQIQQLLDVIGHQLSVMMPVHTSQKTLNEQLRLLLPYIERLSAQRPPDERTKTVLPELRAIAYSLEAVRRAIAATEPDSPRVDELTRAIEMVRSCIEKCDSDGAAHMSDLGIPEWIDWGSPAPHWGPGSGELASSDVLRRVAEIHARLLGPRVFDPQVHRIQLVARRLELAENRVHELHVRMADLRAPAVKSSAVTDY
ncbi:MAG: hypothetical protein JW993_11145 [Sedimentisphaerales bacterium]|nr:hypothetical protein [Sedimentisphaerales bacterium]